MEYLADLHIHTTASDGAFTPAQVVKAASEVGLTAIAITDHDTIEGIDEAVNAGKQESVEVIPGIEISTVYRNNIEVHMLGYFLDHRNSKLLAKLRTLHDARIERGRQIVERLNAAGVPVTFERVLEIAGSGSIGRPHIARAICEVKAASCLDAAFGRFLVEGTPGFVPRYKISPSEAVCLILEAGGVACCAHVAKLNRDELLIELMREGMRGIEVYHPDHGPTGTKYYRKFAGKHGLIATGGSDAHCNPYGKSTSVGEVKVPYDIVMQLKNAK